MLERMAVNIQEGARDVLVIGIARKIAHLSLEAANKVGLEEDERLIQLRGIHAWCHGGFVYIRDPMDAELIQTPMRQLRNTQDVPALMQMWTPILKAMAKKSGKDPSPAFSPSGVAMGGDSDDAVVLSLALAGAIGLAPMKMRLGEQNGRVSYVWGSVLVDEHWHDIDILHDEFDAHPAEITYCSDYEIQSMVDDS